MIDPKMLREQLSALTDVYKHKLFDDAAASVLSEVATLDEQRRRVSFEAEALKQQRNQVSQEIGREKDPAVRAERIAQMDEVKKRIQAYDAQLAELDQAWEQAALQLPNVPDEYVPVGRTDQENKTIREEGTRRIFAFAPKPHWELGEALGILDFERGVKIAGSRFYILKKAGAALQRALIQWMIDVHVDQGYSEVLTPFMVRKQCLYGTGQLPKFGENLYRDAEEDFYFIPTAEVPVTNLYRDEILDEGQLPLKHVAYSACFRREQLAAGRDTRGIKRGHQFDKVEMVQFVHPEQSRDALFSLLRDAEAILQALELPYRVVQMCTGDLSFSACEKYDLEVYSPGVDEWLEVSSCSNFGEFQARRAAIRYRPGKEKPRLVHTLNGSGLALPRTLIAILETYQQADGSIEIPKVLRPYMRGLVHIKS